MIYRVLEFKEGWEGKIMNSESLFSTWSFVDFSSLESYNIITDNLEDVFDGTMIVLAIYTLNFFHPGIFLPLRDDSNSTLMGSDRSERGLNSTPTGSDWSLNVHFK
jgi:hypothetical protein